MIPIFLKITALRSILNSISEDKIADLLIDFDIREFKNDADLAVGLTADKFVRIALAMQKRRPIERKK